MSSKLLNFRANDGLRRRLTFIAAERGITVSEVIREASEDAAREYLRIASEPATNANAEGR